MATLLIFVSLFLTGCQAGVAGTPRKSCGYIPDRIYSCLGSPKVVTPEISIQCDKNLSECDKMICIFKKSGWMDGDKLNKQSVADYFDQFAKDNAEWQQAVTNLKVNCLSTDIPPQGTHLNCPAYDAMHCALTNFMKSAQASQWSTSPVCAYPRQYVAACPICPSDCFVPIIPIGSCNACTALPRSP